MITKEEEKIDTSCKKFKKVQKSNYPKYLKLDKWLEKESNIFEEETKGTNYNYLRYKRGQLIKVDFGINIGTEISHTHYAIILNSDDTTHTDNITVLPLTSKKGYKRINLGNIVMDNNKATKYQNKTFGIITQIKTISKKRILLNDKKIICDKSTMDQIERAINDYLK